MFYGVVYVVSVVDFVDGVYGKLCGVDVYGVNVGSGGENRFNGGIVIGVVLYDEFLYGNVCVFVNFVEYECCYGIGGVMLVGVVFDD